MKFNKKSLLCTFMLVSAMLFALPACSSNSNQAETAHTHTFSDQWTYDSVSHWHEPTCDDISFKSNLEKHTFSNGVCSVCGYQDPNYVPSTGGGNTPEDQNPNEGEGNGDEELTPEEEKLFGGEYTEISDADQISQIKDYLSGVVALLKEGKGYGFGEISYHEKREDIETFLAVSGALGDLSNGADMRYKRMIHSAYAASEAPVCYAEGDYAYEEYSDKSYVYNVKDVGKKLIQRLSDIIYQLISDVPERFEGDCSFSYKQDGAITVVQLFYVKESHDVEGTASIESTQKNTVRFAFFEDKVLGLYKTEKIEYANPANSGYNGLGGTFSVIVGNNPFTIPKIEDCTEQEDYIPYWTR